MAPTTYAIGTALALAFAVPAGMSIMATGCGGQTVEPLDPRDVSLPIETRRWIAATEDGVIVARARLAAERVKLKREEQRREHFEDELSWGAGGDALRNATLALGEARVKLAELRVSHAEAELQLADATYRLATAERAVSHDLARYELEPLREEVASARNPVRQTGAAVADQRRQLETTTSTFWRAYAAYVAAGGDTSPFWIGRESPLQLQGKASVATEPSTETGTEPAEPSTEAGTEPGTEAQPEQGSQPQAKAER